MPFGPLSTIAFWLISVGFVCPNTGLIRRIIDTQRHDDNGRYCDDQCDLDMLAHHNSLASGNPIVIHCQMALPNIALITSQEITDQAKHIFMPLASKNTVSGCF